MARMPIYARTLPALSGAALLLAAAGCGQDPSEPELTGASRGGLEAADPGDAYTRCNRVLAQGIFDEHRTSHDFSSFQVLAANSCEIMKTWSSDDAAWSQPCGTSGQSGEIDVSVEDFFSFGGSGSTSRQWCDSEVQRAAMRRSFYREYCPSSEAREKLAESSAEVLRTASPGIMEAWRQCATQEPQMGLYCWGRKDVSDDQLKFYVEYKRIVGVELGLEWKLENLVATLPAQRTMLENGQVITPMKVKDLGKTSKVIVTATAGDATLSCTYELDPIEGRTCDKNGNIIGELTGRVYFERSPLCERRIYQFIDASQGIDEASDLEVSLRKNGDFVVLKGPATFEIRTENRPPLPGEGSFTTRNLTLDAGKQERIEVTEGPRDIRIRLL